MNKTARMMMMSNKEKKDHYDHWDEDRYGNYGKRSDYGKSHDKNQIRAGGMFWMDDPRKDKHMMLDRETAEHWVSKMDRTDGIGKGGKWTYDQTTQVMKQKNMDLDPVQVFCVMNMLYSDYGKTLSKYGVVAADAYFDLAKDWIDDDDVAAGKEKTAMYYHCIVK